MNRDREVENFVHSSLEATLFLAPTTDGLSESELVEAGSRLGFEKGEIGDAISNIFPNRGWSNERHLADFSRVHSYWVNFFAEVESDPRSARAFEFIGLEFRSIRQKEGAQRTLIERDSLIARGEQAGLQRKELEAAVTILIRGGVLTIDAKNIVRPKSYEHPLPSEQRAMSSGLPRQKNHLINIFPIIQDIIERRRDGRPSSANALVAFEERLETLGHKRFRAWWIQLRFQMQSASEQLQPVMKLVLAAALLEGALSFVVPEAKRRGLMKDVDENEPRRWKLIELSKGLRSDDQRMGAPFDTKMHSRIIELNDSRQRIHAGFLLDAKSGAGAVPDLKPEEARAGAETAEMAIRKIVEWLGPVPAP